MYLKYISCGTKHKGHISKLLGQPRIVGFSLYVAKDIFVVTPLKWKYKSGGAARCVFPLYVLYKKQMKGLEFISELSLSENQAIIRLKTKTNPSDTEKQGAEGMFKEKPLVSSAALLQSCMYAHKHQPLVSSRSTPRVCGVSTLSECTQQRPAESDLWSYYSLWLSNPRP